MYIEETRNLGGIAFCHSYNALYELESLLSTHTRRLHLYNMSKELALCGKHIAIGLEDAFHTPVVQLCSGTNDIQRNNISIH